MLRSKKSSNPPWCDELVQGQNRQPMHAPLHAYESIANALIDGCTAEPPPSRWVLRLTPAQWLFHLAPSPSKAPAPDKGRGFRTLGWGSIAVPCSWQVADYQQGAAAAGTPVIDLPIYANYRYPFAGDASSLASFPVPRENNPVGSYQVEFTIPEAWDGRRIFLVLEGAESNATVWIDGRKVGYSQDSRLPAEFDVTSACAGPARGAPLAADAKVAGQHVLSVQCMRYCDGSYLEDQDHWWLSGLHRHVWLYAKPHRLALVDYHVVTTAVQHEGSSSGPSAEVTISVRCQSDSRLAPSDLESYRLVTSLHGPCLLTPGEPAPPRAELWSDSERLEPADAAERNDVALTRARAACAASCEELLEAGGLLVGDACASFKLRLDNAFLWSAEAPWLYTVVVELRDASGQTIDCEACHVGVRTVKLQNGCLLLNGRELTIRGVNRHDHCPLRGKAVDWATMLTDVKLIKAHSLNAVRTSHYPNASEWYKLCDALGLYVVDEANCETHGCLFIGDEGALAKKRSWRRAFVQRFTRMVQRDKNHACIVGWSLGNEAGYGGHHDAMGVWCRAHEPSRPVQYESCGGAACTDILCPMYPSDELVTRLNTLAGQLASSRKNKPEDLTRRYPASQHSGGMRPVIPCEYAHAMGNSTGNLSEWWTLFESLPFCQGGFIWDFVDQGLAQSIPTVAAAAVSASGAAPPAITLADGTVLAGKRWAYGGDFGERVHDARFCINGLVGPGRRPHPGLFEVKSVLQPVRIALGQRPWVYEAPEDGVGVRGAARATGTIRLRNLYGFRSLAGLRVSVSLQVDGVVVGRSVVECLDDVAAGASLELRIVVPLGDSEATRTVLPEPVVRNPMLAREAFLDVEVTDPDVPAWAHSAARIVATAQFTVTPPSIPPPLAFAGHLISSADLADSTSAYGNDGTDGPGGLSFAEDVERVLIRGGCTGGGAFSLVINRADGTVGPLSVDGHVVLSRGGAALSLWRAPTENDQGCVFTAFAHPKDETIASLVWWYRLLLELSKRLPHWLFKLGASYSDLWSLDGLPNLQPRERAPTVTVAHASSARVDVLIRRELCAPNGSKRAAHDITLTVLRGGAIHLANTASVALVHSDSVARVGLGFALPRQAVGGHQLEWTVRWYGRGPHENYPDRQASAPIGTYDATPAELAEELTVGYVYAQHCGRRGAARWLSLATAAGRGLLVSGGVPFGFTMMPCPDAVIAAAEHPHEVAEAMAERQAAGEPAEHHLTIDHKIMGVGGDVAWFPSVREGYLVPPGTYRWTILLQAFAAWPPPPALPLPADLAPVGAIGGRKRPPAFEPVGLVDEAMRVARLLLLEAPPLTRSLTTTLLLLLALALILAAEATHSWLVDATPKEYMYGNQSDATRSTEEIPSVPSLPELGT